MKPSSVKRKKPSRALPPGLAQVAEMAGVSLMTVSRVISGRGYVAEATRARVQGAIDKLKYRPNKLVHAIRSGRSGTVGVVVRPDSSLTAAIVCGVHDVLAEHSYLPLLHVPRIMPEADRDQAEREYLHRLIDRRVDGIIFWPSDETVPDAYLQEVWDRGVPLVAVDRHLPQTRADFSGTDDVAGGRIAADYLLGLGHRRIAHIGGEPWVATYADRRKGFEHVMTSRDGVAYRAVECKQSHCADIAMDLLSGPARPTALFLASDRMAVDVYAVARKLNLRIGTDLSVVGFADLPETHWLRPRLTTLRQDFYRIGAEAARLVLDRLAGRAGDEKPRSSRILPEIIERESAGPAA